MPQEETLVPLDEEYLEFVRGNRRMLLQDIVYDPHYLALWTSTGHAIPTLAGMPLLARYISTFLQGVHEDITDGLQMQLPEFDSHNPESHLDDPESVEEIRTALSDLVRQPTRSVILNECAEDLLALVRQVRIDSLRQLERFSSVLERRLSILEAVLERDTDRNQRASHLFNAADYLSEELGRLRLTVPTTWVGQFEYLRVVVSGEQVRRAEFRRARFMLREIPSGDIAHARTAPEIGDQWTRGMLANNER